MSKVPTITLNNGVEMPQLGFGVWQVADDEATAAVSTALEAGYRSIDTAAIYENETGTGKALAASGIARDELFVTTKLWNSANETWTRDNVLREFDASLAKLGLDYVDLYLIHWPRAMREDYVTIWRAFAEIAGSGRAKAVGVSNFHAPQLERVIAETSLVPAVNQVELHPDFAQTELRAVHARHGIVTEAWSPLGQGRGLLEEPVLARIGAKHGKSAAQVVLRWHLQVGNVVIPKSVTPSRIRENFDVFGFELDADDLAAIAGLDAGNRLGPNPDEFDWS
ncbi:aldo/keto reductase [Streptomyces sp. UNOB3_S3]|uniref:aldo/keto reductase n=1 Tax=Streptomyces sp. UNOB3_S3 TaxID=2871682 RepID=UPI0027E2B086|nr:aldo/keto reductase [Streptomyces sp. UNOB3_S3]